MRGRKAIPNALKSLRGTDQPTRMRDEMSVDPITDPIISIPRNSPLKTKRSKDIFIRKANQLIALRVLTELDLEQLSIYSYSLDQVYECMEKLKEQGKFKEVYDDAGHVIRYIENPYLRLMRENIEIVNRIGGDFGFSPVSRQKIQVENVEDDNPFKELLGQI